MYTTKSCWKRISLCPVQWQEKPLNPCTRSTFWSLHAWLTSSNVIYFWRYVNRSARGPSASLPLAIWSFTSFDRVQVFIYRFQCWAHAGEHVHSWHEKNEKCARFLRQITATLRVLVRKPYMNKGRTLLTKWVIKHSLIALEKTLMAHSCLELRESFLYSISRSE